MRTLFCAWILALSVLLGALATGCCGPRSHARKLTGCNGYYCGQADEVWTSSDTFRGTKHFLYVCDEPHDGIGKPPGCEPSIWRSSAAINGALTQDTEEYRRLREMIFGKHRRLGRGKIGKKARKPSGRKLFNKHLDGRMVTNPPAGIGLAQRHAKEAAQEKVLEAVTREPGNGHSEFILLLLLIAILGLGAAVLMGSL